MEALGPQLASRPTPPHQAEEVFRYLFALDDLSNDEFLICRRRDYPSSIRLPTSVWGAEEDVELRQTWGSFVLARDLPLGCDGKRSGSRPSRKADAVAAATAEKKSVVAKKDKTAGRAVLIKRPRPEAEPAVESPPPAKWVKKLAKKGAREIHVISSHTTGTTTPSASRSPAAGHSLVEKPPASVAEIVQARPVSGADTPVVPPSVDEASVPQKAVSASHRRHRPHTRQQPPPVSEMAVQAGPSTADRGKRPVEEPTAVSEPLAPSQDQGVPSSEAAVPVGPSTTDRGKRPVEEPEATAESPVHPQDQGFHIPPQEATSAFASWEVEFKAFLSSTTAESGPSAAPTEVADPTALTQLREVRETFSVFQTALKVEQDLQAATAVRDTLHPKIDPLRAKGEVLAELDRQMAELAKRRSPIASELARDFESGGKDRLTEYATTTKRVERLKLDKKNRQAEVIMAEVRWLELKALLSTLLPFSP
nr:neurofilament heavy polypeptide-like [Malus domestica]